MPADTFATMATGFLVVLGTLALLIAVMGLPSGISRLLASRHAHRQEALRAADAGDKQAAAEEEERVLVAVLTAAACEALGTAVHVVRHQNARQRADAQRWVATGKSAHFDSHRVRRR